MRQLNFQPFFERAVAGDENSFTGKVVFSVLIGFNYLIIHSISIGQAVFDQWGWLLSVIITVAMLSLYFATHTLRHLLVEINVRIDTKASVALSRIIKQTLNDKRFIRWGISFGLLNCCVGGIFGIPQDYVTILQKLVIYSGYFTAGFVCGMAVLGIYGVSLLIATFAYKAKHPFDFTFPDGCGGTLFLGEAIAIFSLVTFTVGVLITAYILKAPWIRNDNDGVILLKYMWIAFPYIMALVALLAPAIPISTQLKKYKQERDLYFQNKLDAIRNKLELSELTADELKLLRAEYSYQLEERARLHKMRTWPYGLGVNIQYLLAAVPVFYASFEATSKFIKNH